MNARVILAVVAATGIAHAQPEVVAPPPVAKPPYSLPWQLRAAGVSNCVRSDTAIGFYEPEGASADGRTIASMLVFAYKLSDELAPMVRLGYVANEPPATGGTRPEGGSAFLNPIVGVTYAPKLSGPIRVAGFLGTSLPVGQGGGDSPDAETAAALAAASPTRSGMDGSMLSPNYLGVIPGVDVAYVDHGFTLQGEFTVVQYFRVRGENNPATKDSTRTATTMGVHAGYFVLPFLSLGSEVRYQNWFRNPSIPTAAKRRDNLTLAIGPRVHVQLGKTTWLRPGVAYATGLDQPMRENEYHIVQLDIPVVF